MPAAQKNSIRFNPLTALLWLLIAGGVSYLLWNLITRISGQNLPISTPTANQTQVYQTIAVMLTAQNTAVDATALQTVTPTPSSSQSPVAAVTLPAKTPTSTLVNINVDSPATLGVPCNRAEAGIPLDITIPDDSKFTPGDRFIKTWKLVNTGSCTWTTLYSAYFFYGDRMSASIEMPLREAVQPEQAVEISIEMVAPQSPGAYQGNWELSTENGELFGIGPNADSPFWVRIMVVEEATETPAPTTSITPDITSTAVITPTDTPVGDTKGIVFLTPGEAIDLDSLTLNSSGIDLGYQEDNDGKRWLVPQGEALAGISGSHEPTQADCQEAELSHDPLPIESLDVGIYFCYRTNDARFGRALLESIEPQTFRLSLSLITWATP